MSNQGVTDKVCLVTGGGGGLGKEISKQLLARGAKVVICDINTGQLDATSQELSDQGTLLTIQCDITSTESVEAMFEKVIQTYGKLDVLVNNAGLMDRFDPVGDLERDLWDKVIAVNLTAPYLLSRLAVRQFLAQGATNAAIVNVGSLSSQAGFCAGAAYTASKHGLLGLTKNTAAFYRDKGIRCNLIMPGGMQTNITTAFAQGINQAGQEAAMACFQAAKASTISLEEAARLVVFLASDDSIALSGSCVPVDKGFTSIF